MTSFTFEGPAIGGPANGRVLISYNRTFVVLYPLQIDASTRSAQALINSKSQRVFGTFRYQMHAYGAHRFFLPAHQTLNYFLNRWNPPIEQDYWPAFLQSAITILKTHAQKKAPK